MIPFHSPLIWTAALVIALAGCNMVKTDTVAGTGPIASKRGCEKGAIDYRLPKWKLQIYLVHEVNATPQRHRIVVDPAPIKSADSSQIFCASLVGSIASQDQIGITTENNGLLKRVYTKAIDQSVEIVAQVAQIGAAGQIANATNDFRLSGAQSTFADAKSNRFGPYEIDPFNLKHMELLNNTLATVDLCVTLDGNEDPFIPYLNLCTSGGATANGYAPAFKAGRIGLRPVPTNPLPPEPWGILYRPLLSHSLKVFRKDSDGSWQLVQKHAVELPNAAPALAVSVKRAAFAARETNLMFEGGVLYSVDMEKGSELAGFALLPIKVAQVIVGIPAEIIKVRIQSASQNTTLIKANNDLIAALAELKKAEVALAEAQATQANKQSQTGSNPLRSSAVFRSLTNAEQALLQTRIQTYCLNSTSTANARNDCMTLRGDCVAKGTAVEECLGS